MKHRTVVQMLDGAVWRGTVETVATDRAEQGSGKIGGDRPLYFESSDGDRRGFIEMDTVKAIYVGDEPVSDTGNSPRFFDCAPIPATLWVRTAFVDGEVVEGMIANAWSAFNGDLLELRLPSQRTDHQQVLIPRSSIAELQVITTR